MVSFRMGCVAWGRTSSVAIRASEIRTPFGYSWFTRCAVTRRPVVVVVLM